MHIHFIRKTDLHDQHIHNQCGANLTLLFPCSCIQTFLTKYLTIFNCIKIPYSEQLQEITEKNSQKDVKYIV